MTIKKLEHLSHAADSRVKGEVSKLKAGYTKTEHKIIGYKESLPTINAKGDYENGTKPEPRESLVQC